MNSGMGMARDTLRARGTASPPPHTTPPTDAAKEGLKKASGGGGGGVCGAVDVLGACGGRQAGPRGGGAPLLRAVSSLTPVNKTGLISCVSTRQARDRQQPEPCTACLQQQQLSCLDTQGHTVTHRTVRSHTRATHTAILGITSGGARGGVGVKARGGGRVKARGGARGRVAVGLFRHGLDPEAV